MSHGVSHRKWTYLIVTQIVTEEVVHRVSHRMVHRMRKPKI